MIPFRWNRLPKSKSRSAPRGRRGRNAVRPQIEGLEQRLALTVNAGVDYTGQLLITTNQPNDSIILNHVGTTTYVDGYAYPDSGITNGISIKVDPYQGDLATITIQATSKPVTVDGGNNVAAVTLGDRFGYDGVQNIRANVALHNLGMGLNPPPGTSGTPHVFTLTVDDTVNN
jgi:hypothetical protein